MHSTLDEVSNNANRDHNGKANAEDNEKTRHVSEERFVEQFRNAHIAMVARAYPA
jgi:hypothetical protein